VTYIHAIFIARPGTRPLSPTSSLEQLPTIGLYFRGISNYNWRCLNFRQPSSGRCELFGHSFGHFPQNGRQRLATNKIAILAIARSDGQPASQFALVRRRRPSTKRTEQRTRRATRVTSSRIASSPHHVLSTAVLFPRALLFKVLQMTFQPLQDTSIHGWPAF
jgi:hypothetical protein